MFARLKLHIDYLLRTDPEFPRAIRRLNAEGWRLRLRLLNWVEGRRLTLALDGQERQTAQLTAVLGTPHLVAILRERDFPCQPPAARWIASSLNADCALLTYRRVSGRLVKFLHRCSVPGIGFYGGLKAREAIVEKIAPFESNGAELDLWDVVRFRIVTPNLQGLFTVCSQLLAEFDAEVVRCRNYYLHPREGNDDPYRAVHFELRDEEDGFVEIQVMTALREAVGIVDHSLVRKRSTAFIDVQHKRWLMDLSHAANMIDAEWGCGVIGSSEDGRPNIRGSATMTIERKGAQGREPENTGVAWNYPDFHGGSGNGSTIHPSQFRKPPGGVQPGGPVPCG